MSCHTWAYTPLKEEDMHWFIATLLKQISYWSCIPLEGESREDYLARRKHDLETHFMYENQEEKDADIAGVLEDDNRDYEKYKAFASFIKSNPSFQEFHDKIDSFGEYYGWSGFPTVNGRIYKECGFDVPVRIYGYPEETFTNAEKFIKWIKENNIKPERNYKEVSLKEAAKLIRDFWAEYNNEIYVEFG